jgi:signal transduction histidine kinase
MLFPASIRWRLQAWLAILLTGLLAAFATSAWQLEKSQRVKRLDDELEERAVALGVAIRPPGMGMKMDGPPSRPPSGPDDFGRGHGDRGPGPPKPRMRELPAEVKAMFPGSKGEGYYYAVWAGRSERLEKSAHAPAELPMPAREARDTRIRFRERDGVREAYHFTEMGECVLAGRPTGGDLTGMGDYASMLGLAGLAVLAVGLGGGWWITTRSIRPVEDIATAAKRISQGDLSERIRVDGSGSELGQLAEVLNGTFAQLEESFARQRRFTADASHELRTPLAVLIAETQTALSRSRSADEYRETLAGNLDTARRMKRLAEALLELARIDAAEPPAPAAAVALAEAVAEVLGRLRPMAEPRQVSLRWQGENAIALARPERVALVISNLVENAIHHGREGGTVTVTTGGDAQETWVRVEDDGPGIAAEHLPHVFERFYRADAARGSGGRYGLGLAICKGLVEAEGGRIEVASEPGQGATFTVRWPAFRVEAVTPCHG